MVRCFYTLVPFLFFLNSVITTINVRYKLSKDTRRESSTLIQTKRIQNNVVKRKKSMTKNKIIVDWLKKTQKKQEIDDSAISSISWHWRRF